MDEARNDSLRTCADAQEGDGVMSRRYYVTISGVIADRDSEPRSLVHKETVRRLNAMQDVVDVAGDIVSDGRPATVHGRLKWSIYASTIAELRRRLADLEPKTIDQLQKERNEAADALRHYMKSGLAFQDAINAYDAAAEAHEAAIKANK